MSTIMHLNPSSSTHYNQEHIHNGCSDYSAHEPQEGWAPLCIHRKHCGCAPHWIPPLTKCPNTLCRVAAVCWLQERSLHSSIWCWNKPLSSNQIKHWQREVRAGSSVLCNILLDAVQLNHQNCCSLPLIPERDFQGAKSGISTQCSDALLKQWQCASAWAVTM